MAIDSKTLASYSGLLRRFSGMAVAQRSEQTFLEIAKLQTSELTYSNVWKFFLSPDERHGLGDLVLRSLLEASGAAVDASGLGAADVHREVPTASGKFIDLLITTRSFIAAVENKIDAPIYNDLADYSHYVDLHADGRATFKILLCLSDEVSCEPFIPLTYNRFFAQLRRNLDARTHRRCINDTYLLYLNDAMKTIRTLVNRDKPDEGLRQFIANHEAAAVALADQINRLKDEFHDKIRTLERLIRSKPSRKGISKSDAGEKQLYESLWLEFRGKSKPTVTFEVWISPTGWQTEAYREKDTARKKSGKRFGYDAQLEDIAIYCDRMIKSILVGS